MHMVAYVAFDLNLPLALLDVLEGYNGEWLDDW
jgi:hypothetical protein